MCAQGAEQGAATETTEFQEAREGLLYLRQYYEDKAMNEKNVRLRAQYQTLWQRLCVVIRQMDAELP